MMVTHNGDSLDDHLGQSLEEMYLETAPAYINDLLCSPGICFHVACWRLVWMEGACLHMPRHICHMGKILLEDIMLIHDRFVCNICAEPLVPAAIVPLYSKGRFPVT